MTTQDNCARWEIYPGDKLTSLALPDYYSIYYSYTFDTTKYPNTGLLIRGDFPYARYMSFNIYATRVGDSLGALTDYQIKTPNPKDNPFVAGNNWQPTDRHYRIRIQPSTEGDVPLGLSISENLLTYDPDDLIDPKFPNERQLLTVIIRYYVVDGINGNVDCPSIETYPINDPNSLSPAPPTDPTFMDLNEPIFRDRLAKIFDTVGPDDGKVLRFYHAAGGGQFNNADNLYLISAVKNVDGRDNVLMMRIRPPSFPREPNEMFDQTDVRYWSINQGDPDTSTPIGMKDSVFLPAKGEPYIYIVMGDDNVKVTAAQGGYNFLRWVANKEEAVVLYRNMLTIPQYRGSIARVPQLPTTDIWDESVFVEYEASQFLDDYAPKGKIVSALEFNTNYGGWPHPGFVPLPTNG